MTEKELKKLIRQLRQKESKFLTDKPRFLRAIIAQRIEDQLQMYVEHPFFVDEEDVLEALLKEFEM